MKGRTAPPSGPLKRGDMCGQYEILREHARGGMAIVYRAQDIHGQRRAIKVMKPTKGFFEKREKRFQQEIKALRKIVDDHVVRFFEAGKRGSIVWLAMEFFDGETLTELIARRSGELSTAELLDIGIQLARGLSEIHKCKVIHRDLKPDNVMINASGHVKIFDFGIAKYDGSFTTTEPGTTPVTVLYMSPEQAAAERLDARTDIFNFGLIMHELISGQHAIDGVDQSRTVNEVVAHIVRNDVRPLEPDECDPALAALVSRALEQDRERRIASAAELVTALAELIRAERRRADAVSSSLTESTERQLRAGHGKLRLIHSATEPIAVAEPIVPEPITTTHAERLGAIPKDTIPLAAWTRHAPAGGIAPPPSEGWPERDATQDGSAHGAVPSEHGVAEHGAAEHGASVNSAGSESLHHTQPLPLRATEAIADRSASRHTSRRAVSHTLFMAYQRRSRRDRWLMFAAGIAVAALVTIPLTLALGQFTDAAEPDTARRADAVEQPAGASTHASSHEPAAAVAPVTSGRLTAQQGAPAAVPTGREGTAQQDASATDARSSAGKSARGLPPGVSVLRGAPSPRAPQTPHRERAPRTAPDAAADSRDGIDAPAPAPPLRSAARRPTTPHPKPHARQDHGF